MIVLCYGMTKSGSTLAFELCKAVLEQRGYQQRRLPDTVTVPGRNVNFINEVSISRLRAALADSSDKEIIAIKVHAPAGATEIKFIESAIADGTMKVQVNLRDPREICLSLVDAGRKAREKNRGAFAEIVTLADAAAGVGKQLRVCRNWGAINGALHLLYNDVAFDAPRAVQEICADFGFPMLDESELATAMSQVFEDAFTQRNKAVKDRYRSDMSEQDGETLLAQLGGGRAFVRHVCEQRDFEWFRRERESA